MRQKPIALAATATVFGTHALTTLTCLFLRSWSMLLFSERKQLTNARLPIVLCTFVGGNVGLKCRVSLMVLTRLNYRNFGNCCANRLDWVEWVFTLNQTEVSWCWRYWTIGPANRSIFIQKPNSLGIFIQNFTQYDLRFAIYFYKHLKNNEWNIAQILKSNR